MASEAKLEFRVNTLSERIGIWFYIWRMSLFSSLPTEVVVESAIDDGYYRLPLCLGEERFGAMIQGAHPELLICESPQIRIRMDLKSSMFEMKAQKPETCRLLDVVKQRIMALEAIPEVRIPAVGYEHKRVVARMKSRYWAEKLGDAMKAANVGNVAWVEARRTAARQDDPVSTASPDLIFSGVGDRFIVYDHMNDRLMGGCAALDILPGLIK